MPHFSCHREFFRNMIWNFHNPTRSHTVSYHNFPDQNQTCRLRGLPVALWFVKRVPFVTFPFHFPRFPDALSSLPHARSQFPQIHATTSRKKEAVCRELDGTAFFDFISINRQAIFFSKTAYRALAASGWITRRPVRHSKMAGRNLIPG